MPDPQWTISEAVKAQRKMAYEDLRSARVALIEGRYEDMTRDLAAVVAQVGALAAYESILDGKVGPHR